MCFTLVKTDFYKTFDWFLFGLTLYWGHARIKTTTVLKGEVGVKYKGLVEAVDVSSSGSCFRFSFRALACALAQP